MESKILTLNVKIKACPPAFRGLQLTQACEIYTLMNESRAVGRIIRARREQAGLNLGDLAECIGKTEAEMSRKETGKSAISLDQLDALARRLGTTLEQVLKEARADIPVDPERAEWDALFAALSPEDRRAFVRLAKLPPPKKRALQKA